MPVPKAKRTWRKASTAQSSKRVLWLKPAACVLAAIACVQFYSGWFGVDGIDGRRSSSRFVINLRKAEPHDNNTNTIGPWTFDAHASDVFRPSSRPWTLDNFYEGLPVGSDLRPSGQFYVAAAETKPPSSPIITIVTATRNPRAVFFTRTVRFVLQQSLQAFRWVVVNDGSDDEVALSRLHQLKRWAAAREPDRILVVDRPVSSKSRHRNHPKRGNGPAAMNYGLRFVNTKFVAILDDDDLWELTTLEKAALVMTWVPHAYAVSFDVVNHGAHQFVWRRGFFNGDESFLTENNLMQGSPFRSSVLLKCRFREDMADGGADWDFWMCMASQGMWGLHVPEVGNWYQWNPPDFRKKRWKAVTTHQGLEELREGIHKRYAHLLDETAWPAMVLPETVATSEQHRVGHGDYDKYRPPFVNRLTRGHRGRRNDNNKAVLLVLRDLAGFNATNILHFAKAYARAGWRVTVLMTHYADNEEDATGRQQLLSLMQCTHDVFTAANVAPLLKLPELVAYLVESRGVEALVVMPETTSSSPPWHISRRLVDAGLALLPPKSATVAVVEANELNSSSSDDIISDTEQAMTLSRIDNGRRQAHDDRTSSPSWVEFLRQLYTYGRHHHHLDRNMDMRRVQLALQYRKKRAGFGRELQIACPERVYGNTQWIDALERPTACEDGLNIELKASLLQKSALKQCGAWCLANLELEEDRPTSIIGWEFTGSCFRPLGSADDSPKCAAELARFLRPPL